MKDEKLFNILGFMENLSFRSGVTKNQQGDCLKGRGAWIVCRFKDGLGKIEGVGDAPMHAIHLFLAASKEIT